MQDDHFINLIPRIAIGQNKYADIFNSDKSIIVNRNSLNSIYVVGANFYGVGLLNTVRVLLAYAAHSAMSDNVKFTILDPGRSDYIELIGSPFLNGEIITSESDILTILENSSEIDFDFTNVIVLNHYDWLKNNLDEEYSFKCRAAVEKLVSEARSRNVIFIVVDRAASVNEDVPDFDAILCFHLESEVLSKHILGVPGAELLKDKGDSLYLNRRTGKINHGQIPLLSENLFNGIIGISEGKQDGINSDVRRHYNNMISCAELLSARNRARGAMIGLAVGDALGAPIEFDHTSTMIRDKMDVVRHFHDSIMPPRGVWTDDTSMALCLADSLIEKRGYDSYDIMNRFAAWEFCGYRSYYPMGYGVGMQTDIAITEYMENPILKKDEPETKSIANGCIMRLAPIVIANIENTQKNIIRAARLSCRETHNSSGAMAITELMAATLYLILKGEPKDDLLEKAKNMIKNESSRSFLESVDVSHERIFNKKGDDLRDLGGYALDSYDIAMWGLINFDSFLYGVLGVLGLGGDTDTNAAIYGQLAGAYYGYDLIPDEWKKEVYLAEDIKNLADKLCEIKKYEILCTRFEDDPSFKNKGR